MRRHALIFAAGKGERLRPLTLHTPKPLLPVGGKPLIEWHIEKLAAIGITDVVINTSWLAERFPETLGDGSRWGLRLHFSYEGEEPLETGGGLRRALPLLGDAPFIAINGDVWCTQDFSRLPLSPEGRVHVLMVPMPDFRIPGRFEHLVSPLLPDAGGRLHTFAGIAVYRPEFIAHREAGRYSVLPDLIDCAERGLLSADRIHGEWEDVGTADRLAALDQSLRQSGPVGAS